MNDNRNQENEDRNRQESGNQINYNYDSGENEGAENQQASQNQSWNQANGGSYNQQSYNTPQYHKDGSQNPYGNNGASHYNQGPNKNNNWRKVALGTAIAVGVIGIGSAGFYSVGKLADRMKEGNQFAAVSEAPSETTGASSKEALETTEEALATTDSVAQVVENVMPSIVSITITTTETVSDYFGRLYSEDVTGSGSGIIIGQNSNEVLIVTNNHVVSGANATVQLTFCDDEMVTGTVKGADASADLAVVSVKFADISDDTKSKIKVISMGDSDTTKVGEMAIAIGNALGYGQAVTVGHISALNREIAVEDSSMTLMQTDAAINPGNSGGALLNARGQLIGINSAKTATTEVEGMGYAIPISDALPIIQNLMEGNTSSEAYLGIVGRNIEDSNAQRFNIPKGVYIREVAEGSPAEQAGLKVGMVIVGFDGKEITTTDDMISVLDSLSVGDKVTINVAVNQNGQYTTKDYTVTIGAKSDYEESAKDSQESGSQETNPYGSDSYGTNPYGDGSDSYSDPFRFFGN